MSIRNLGALLASRRVVLVGQPQGPLQQSCLDQLRETVRDSADWPRSLFDARVDDTRIAGSVVVVFEPALLDAGDIERLAAAGARGLVWLAHDAIPERFLQIVRRVHLRVLGPRSSGYFQADGLRAGAFPVQVHVGGLALIAQSGSIAAAAADWAAGRGIGFSWAVTTGAEADTDVADWLDHAALDPRTRAVILQVGRLRRVRKFMSAARACARVKPVVVLQSRVGGSEGLAGPDPVRSAAFARAGLVECHTLDGLFDALTAMARLPVRAQARVLVLGNGAGMCALGVDAVLRHGLTPAAVSADVRAGVSAEDPGARFLEGSIDLGSTTPASLVSVLRCLLADEGIDYLLLVQSPSQPAAHDPYADALIEARLGPRVVTAWLGLASAVEVRRRSTHAGLATFVTAGQAARALRYRWLYGRTRELLMQTPPVRERRRFRSADAQALIDTVLARDGRLSALETDRVLDYYSLPPADADPGSLRFAFAIAHHPELGAHLTVSAHSDRLQSPVGHGFPPLDALLAERMLESLGLDLSAELLGALRRVLYALAQIVIDLPAVHDLRIEFALNEAGGLVRAGSPALQLAAETDARSRLLVAPYPEQLQYRLELRNGRRYRVRPILPEDEPALVVLLESLRPEDVRLRFFASIRYFSHEMAARMTQIDYDREFVLVVVPDNDESRLCAIAHLVADPDGVEGEYAVLVHHEHAGAGLGRALMEELIAHARRQKLQRVVGDVLRENVPMLTLARRLGFTIGAPPDDEEDATVRHVTLELDAPAAG